MYFWKIAGTKARLTEQSYKHHYNGSEIYIALRKTGKHFAWFHTDGSKDKRWDRAMHWQGVFIPIEIHRGTQSVEVVIEKAKYYATLPNCRPLWTVSDYRPNPFEDIEKTAKQSGQEILTALKDVGLVAQPLITPHAKFVANPLNQILVSPANRAFSLFDIVSESTSV